MFRFNPEQRRRLRQFLQSLNPRANWPCSRADNTWSGGEISPIPQASQWFSIGLLLWPN
jgi:hypothetical protein